MSIEAIYAATERLSSEPLHHHPRRIKCNTIRADHHRMNRIGPVIAFSILLALAACSEEPTEIVAAQPGDGSSTIVTEVETSMPADVSTTFAPPDTEPDTSHTTEMGENDPQKTDDDEDQEWQSHELANLIITPERLGESWEIDTVVINEPEPGDEDELVCGIPAPATLAGLDVQLVGRDSETDFPNQELFQLVGRGTPAEAQAWIDAFVGLGDCDGSDEGDPTDATLADVSVAGSDSAVGLVLTDNASNGAVSMRFVGARFDDVFVLLGHSTESADELQSFEWLQEQVSWSGAQIE